MSEEQELVDKVQAQIEEVNQLLSGRKTAKALQLFLQDPPLGVKDQEVKDKASEAVMNVIRMIKDAEIDSYLSDLSSKEADVLLQYVFKGFEKGDYSNSLLKWHAAIHEKWGLGTSVRAMSARKTAT